MLGYEDIDVEDQEYEIVGSFNEDLKVLISKTELCKLYDTPSFILADLMVEALCNYAEANKRRDKWLQKRNPAFPIPQRD